MRKMNMIIYFENRQDKLAVTYKLKMLIRAAVEATLDYEQYENPAEVSITFTDNEDIHALNQKFRGVDRPTDVLSFPLFDYEGESEEPPVDELIGMLGDVVLSLEQAAPFFFCIIVISSLTLSSLSSGFKIISFIDAPFLKK